MRDEWDTGATPWLRQHQTEASFGGESKPVQCMFCGGQTVKRSASDRDEDPGRLELYCDNQLCDAREMVLLVRRDGADAVTRADVRALRLLDEGTLDVHASYPPEFKSYDRRKVMEEHSKIAERRMRQQPPYTG